MIPVYLNELIDVLIAKTNSNSCYWNRTSSQGQYKLMLKGGMVVLSYREGLLSSHSKSRKPPACIPHPAAKNAV